MTAPKRTRWVCPECDDARLAPTRLRTIDVRRYCLPCSEKTGKLVTRTTPTLDRRRAAQAAKRSESALERRARTQARERDRLTIDGTYLPDEARRLWKLLRVERGWKRELPEITFRRSTKEATTGRCWYATREIVVTVGTDRASAVEVLLHELVHAVVRSEGHSARFWSIVRATARAAWPEIDFRFDTMPSARGYSVDHWISDKIREQA